MSEIGGRVVYVVRSFPRLSQTFILNELLALEALGINISVISLVRADERLTHERLARLRAPVVYLDERRGSLIGLVVPHLRLFGRRPLGYLRAAWRLARQPEATLGYHGVTRRQAFDLGVVAALEIGVHRRHHGVARIHAHFAHDPALVALIVGDLSGVPFSFTGHARDLVQISPRALGARVEAARAVVTCCAMNADLLRAVSGSEDHGKVAVIRHGIDVEAFVPPPDSSTRRRGAVASVGRMIDKKGFEVLIDAVAQVVGSGDPVHLTIYGDGPLQATLAARIAAAELDDHVMLAGECTQSELQRLLPTYALFALTPHVSDDGDRDGLPTVLVEAMACGLPVVTTDVAGIPDLVEHGVNGIMCPPRQVAPVSAALRMLLADDDRRERMGVAARATVIAGFNAAITSRRVADLLLDRSPDGPRRAGRRTARRGAGRAPECAGPPA